MSLLAYSFASGITLIALSAVYMIMQRNTTLFALNRACLIFILTASLFMPFISLPSFGVPNESFAEPGNLTTVAVGNGEVSAKRTIDYIGILRMIYLIGVIVMAARTLANFGFIIYLRLKSRKLVINAHTVRAHRHKHIPPMSWGGDIYIAETIISESSESELEMILAHEGAHRRRYHWADLLLSNVVLAVNWYNPAAWMIQRELIAVHEYEADRIASDLSGNQMNYQLLLIKKTAGSRFQAIADSLNHSSLKKRITMMMKNQSKRSARLRSLALLPAVAVALLVSNSSCVKDAQKEVTESEPAIESQTAEPKAETPIVESEAIAEPAEAVVPTKMPEFEGGLTKLYQMLSDNLVYPKDAIEKGIEGKVIIELKVGSDGQITDAQVKKGVNDALDRAALDAVKKVMKAGGKFTPAVDAEGHPCATTFVLPVSFKLQ